VNTKKVNYSYIITGKHPGDRKKKNHTTPQADLGDRAELGFMAAGE
jgi:hypothetical protein